MTEFVPQNLGFPHIIREDIIQRNTRPLGNFFKKNFNPLFWLQTEFAYIFQKVVIIRLPDHTRPPQAPSTPEAKDDRVDYRIHCHNIRTLSSRCKIMMPGCSTIYQSHGRNKNINKGGGCFCSGQRIQRLRNLFSKMFVKCQHFC